MTRGNPLVSVVIPTRNRPGLVLRALRSVWAQSFTDTEIIVVVDGETSGETATRLNPLSGDRLRLIETSEQVGGAEARNIGVRAARSEWIALLDDDDEWLPSKLAAQISRARQYPGERHIVLTCQHIHRSRGVADVIRPRRLPRPGEAPYEFMFDYLCYFQTSTFVCSRELMLKVPFEKDLPFFQDIDWFLRATRDPDTRLVVVEEPLSIYHAPEERATVTTNLGWRARLNWGRAKRHLMSRRAYARFIVGSCAGRAAQDRAGIRGFGRLLYECLMVGSPTPQLLLLLCGTYALRPGLRKKVRDRMLLRRMPPAIANSQLDTEVA